MPKGEKRSGPSMIIHDTVVSNCNSNSNKTHQQMKKKEKDDEIKKVKEKVRILRRTIVHVVPFFSLNATKEQLCVNV